MTGTDDTGAADTLRPTGAREDDSPNVGFKAQVLHVRPVETRENGHRQDSEVAVRGVAGRTQDCIVAVHGDEIHVPGSQLSDSGADRLGNIEEFEVGKHFLVPGAKPVGQLEVPAGKEELQADLVEGNGVGQRIDDLTRLRGSGNIEREDQAVGRGDGCGDVGLPKQSCRGGGCRSGAKEPTRASGGRSSFPACMPARGRRRCRVMVSRETLRALARSGLAHPHVHRMFHVKHVPGPDSRSPGLRERRILDFSWEMTFRGAMTLLPALDRHGTNSLRSIRLQVHVGSHRHVRRSAGGGLIWVG